MARAPLRHGEPGVRAPHVNARIRATAHHELSVRGKARLHGRHRVLLLARSGHANTHDVFTVERVQNRDEIAAHDEHSLPRRRKLDARNRGRRLVGIEQIVSISVVKRIELRERPFTITPCPVEFNRSVTLRDREHFPLRIVRHVRNRGTLRNRRATLGRSHEIGSDRQSVVYGVAYDSDARRNVDVLQLPCASKSTDH